MKISARKIWFYSVIILVARLTAQDVSRIPQPISVINFPHALTIGGLNGLGLSFTTTEHIADIAVGNPASLSLYNSLTAGISFQHWSDLDISGMIDLQIKQLDRWFPQSAGIVYPLKNARIALGMSRRYNIMLDLGQISVGSEAQPDGTGAIIEPVLESSVSSYSIVSSYGFDQLLSSRQITIAFRFNFDYLDYHEQILNITGDASGFATSWAIGALADFDLQSGMSLQFGATYEKDIRIEENEQYKSIDLFGLDIDTLGANDRVDAVLETFPIIAQIPGRLSFGIKFIFSDLTGMDASISQVLWSDIYDTMNDVIEYAVNIHMPVAKGITASAGVYATTLDYTNNFPGISEESDALYLIVGTRIEWLPVHFDLVLADSHFASSSEREQTLVKLAAALSL